MGNGFKIGQHATAHVIKGVHNKTMKPLNSAFGIGGHFNVTCYDKDGNLKWETVAKNGVTNVGLNSTLDVYFNATDSVGGVGTAGWGWALGLIDNAGGPAWTSNAAASQSVVNPALIDYDVSGVGTVYGVFIAGGNIAGVTPAATDADDKGSVNATPLLWATAQFSAGPQAVTGGDILRVTYTINAASA
jgi:hypothetical protein